MASESDSSKPKSIINLRYPDVTFGQFLDLEDNKRIFFSGKFGIGKTFFLKDFFQARKDRYDVYHLFPVKYQITSNEDIIKLLRYDILVELVQKYPDLLDADNKNDSISWLQQVGFFIKQSNTQESLLNCVANVANAIPALGRPVAETADFIREIRKLAQGWQETGMQLRQSDIEKMYQDMQQYKNETNELDGVLNKTIKEHKGTKNRKSVLILDDFDRIDPEHIFRILNVFSSLLKIDKDGHGQVEDNKFGFDYVIIVGDRVNIENIFRHRYGQDADFVGYFDKFVSIYPYEFDNRTEVQAEIPKLIQNLEHLKGNYTSDKHGRNYMELVLQTMLIMILQIDNLNLRELYKLMEQDFQSVHGSSNLRFLDSLNRTDVAEAKPSKNRFSIQFAVTVCLQYLITMLGKKKLKEIIEQNNEPRYLFDNTFSEIIIRVLCESNIQPDSEEVAIIKKYYDSARFSQDEQLAHQYASKSLIVLIDAY